MTDAVIEIMTSVWGVGAGVHKDPIWPKDQE